MKSSVLFLSLHFVCKTNFACFQRYNHTAAFSESNIPQNDIIVSGFYSEQGLISHRILPGTTMSKFFFYFYDFIATGIQIRSEMP
jgi:hypothetical protein